MSDCSTAAIVPKDKTCPCQCDSKELAIKYGRSLQEIVELEQHYQQLEQVALEMWSLIKNIEREYPRLLDPNRGLAPQTIHFPPSVEFAERLKEIEVVDGD